MPISHKYKCIFVHVSKVAGTSVAKALDIYSDDINSLYGKIGEDDRIKHNLNGYFWQHLPVRRLKKFIPEGIFNEYFKFTFVRNPWDRCVSMYFYLKERQRMPYERFMRRSTRR